MGTVVVGAVVLVILGLAGRSVIRGRRAGGCGCGCSGCDESKSKNCSS